MKAALDASVLTAALIVAHPDHGRAIRWLDAIASGQASGVVAARTLADLFSALIKMPVAPPITAPQAQAMITCLRPLLTVVPEDEALVTAAVGRCAVAGAPDAVSNAVLVVVAENSGADIILTFQEAYLRPLASAATPRIAAPADPLSPG